jgi:hypothetical protein
VKNLKGASASDKYQNDSSDDAKGSTQIMSIIEYERIGRADEMSGSFRFNGQPGKIVFIGSSLPLLL